MSLFEGTAQFYRRYRPGVPADVAEVLLRAVPDHRPRRLLDIGTGTGLVVQALRDGFDDILGIDVDSDLLQVARSTLRPGPGQELRFLHARAEDFEPSRGWAADLVTICRAFHWLDRPRVLHRLDRIVASDGAVAILSDRSIWAADAPWKQEVKAVLAQFLGEQRRAGDGAYQQPTRPYSEDLEESPFSVWQQVTVPVRRERTLDEVIGYLHSSSFAAPRLFGDRLGDFDRTLRERLPGHATGGVFVDDNDFQVLLARRPSKIVR